MFLSQYSMLKSLGYGDDSYLKEETDKILSPYNLFVLVLHDPQTHTSFHGKFSNLFERLDYVTGQNLLFMGIAKPSIGWYSRNENRDYFGIWEKDQLIRSFHEIKSKDNSIACYSIIKALNMDYDDLPALIITPSLRNGAFAVVKTDESKIEKQLGELGFFATTAYNRVVHAETDEFKQLLREIDLLNHLEIKNLNKPLASILADSLSFTVGNNSHFSKDATNHARNVIIKQKKEISRKNSPEEAETIKLNMLANLANRYSNTSPVFDQSEMIHELKSIRNMMPSSSPAVKNQISLKEIFAELNGKSESLEYESKIISITTNCVYQLYESQQEVKTFDYSPLVLGLSKIFEIEINLSIVHWVRKYLNIEMPEFFKKYKPDFDNSKISPDRSLVNNPIAIDFNMRRGAKWHAPGIGQSELIVRSLFNKKVFIETFIEPEESKLLVSWSPIREFRNRAVHNDIMNKKDFESVAFNMKTLIDSGNINKILSLKKIYQGIV